MLLLLLKLILRIKKLPVPLPHDDFMYATIAKGGIHMDKVKIGTMAVAFMYTIYHINNVGLNIGNGLVLALVLFCIAIDCYRYAKRRTTEDKKSLYRK